MANIPISSTVSAKKTIKLLYSYGGKIIPRRTDGKLRFVGGLTRVISVDRFISFAELMVKFSELCGSSMTLKCKLPNEDLDVLISITSDEDLKNVIDEYHRFSANTHKEYTKITAVLFPIKSLKKIIHVSSAEDLCFPAHNARATSQVRKDLGSERKMMYRRLYSRCRRGVSHENMCFVPIGKYCI